MWCPSGPRRSSAPLRTEATGAASRWNRWSAHCTGALYAKRTLKRLDVTSRSLIALIEPGSCFAGTLFELALACDRQYMLDDEGAAQVVLTECNFGGYPMGNGLDRLAARFHGDPDHR